MTTLHRSTTSPSFRGTCVGLALGLLLGAGRPAPASQAPEESPEAIAPELAAQLDATVSAWHAAGQFDGALLVSRGGRVWSTAAGSAVREWDVPITPATRFPIASLTKQFTAVLVMQLVEQGELELDAPLLDALPWYREDTGAAITLRDLLSHTSGLPEVPGEVYARELTEDEDTRWFVRTHCSGDPRFEPGTDFDYTNTDYHVLGAVLEELSGVSFEELLGREVLEPLGMGDSGIARRAEIQARRAQDYVPIVSSGGAPETVWLRGPSLHWENWHAAGGMLSTVQDLDRWNRALHENRLVSSETWEAMLRPRTDVGSSGNYVALGSWVYPRSLPGSELAPTLVERRGAIGGFAALNVLVRGEPTWIVLLANSYNEQIHQLPWGSSLPLDLLLVLRGLEPEGPPAGR